jgi:hypothetical protein
VRDALCLVIPMWQRAFCRDVCRKIE